MNRFHKWLKANLAYLHKLADQDEYTDSDFEDAGLIVAEAARCASELGLSTWTRYAACERIAPATARRILSEMIAATAPPPKQESEWLDSEGAANYLGITLNSLYGEVERRKLVPDGRGPKRRYRFKSATLDAYVRQRR